MPENSVKYVLGVILLVSLVNSLSISATVDELGVYGPYDEIDRMRVCNSNNWSFCANKGEEWFTVVNGTEYGPMKKRRMPNFSTDFSQWAFVVQRSDGCYFIVNGDEYGPYPEIGGYGISNDGKIWAFNFKRDDRVYFSISGEEWGPYNSVSNYPNLSDKGNHWGYIVYDYFMNEYMLIDGVKYGPYANICHWKLFNPDKKYPGGTTSDSYFDISYDNWAFTSMNQDGFYMMVINGETWGPYIEIDKFLFSESGTAWYFLAKDAKGDYIVVNGVEYGPYETNDFKKIKITLSPDGSRWVMFREDKEDTYYVVIDGEEEGPYLYCASCYFCFSKDSKKLYFGIQKEDGWYLRRNDEEYGPFLEGPYFSHLYSNKAWGFTGLKEEGEYVYIDGERYGPFESASSISFSKDGEQYAFSYKIDGNHYKNIDGVIYGPYLKKPDFRFIGEKDESWVMTIKKDEGVYIVVNGEEFGPYSEIYDYRFLSDNGKEWSFAVYKNEKLCLLNNGMEYDIPNKYTRYREYLRNSYIPAFSVKDDDGEYIIIDSEIYGPFSMDSKFYIYSNEDSWAFSAEWLDGYHIVMNGDQYGPYKKAKTYADDTTVGFIALEDIGDGYYRVIRVEE